MTRDKDDALDVERTWSVTWLNSKPFMVTSTLRQVAFEYMGCRIEPVSDSDVRKLERKAYLAELANKKLKKAKK